jgi:hypothetical protein
MTSNSVDLKTLDLALKAHYSGITIRVAGVVTSVPVFLEKPSSETSTSRVYPSICLAYLGDFEDTEVCESTDFENEEEVGYDGSQPVHIRTSRKVSGPMRVRYMVDTWHKDLVLEDRDLSMEVFLKRTKPRGTLSVNNIDGEAITLWMFRANSGLQVMDYAEGDVQIFHKSVIVEVLAYLSEVEYDEVVEDKVAMELHWDVRSRGVKLNELGQIDSAVESDDVTDRNIRITENTEEILP